MIILLKAPFPDTSYKLCYFQVCDETRDYFALSNLWCVAMLLIQCHY